MKMTDNNPIMGIKTKACVNGVYPDTIPTINQNISNIQNDVEDVEENISNIQDDVGNLDERVTALEQGGSSSEQYQDILYSFKNYVFDENKISRNYLKKFKYYIPDTTLNGIFSTLEQDGEYQDDLFDIKVETTSSPFPVIIGKIKKDIVICINFDLFPNSISYLYNNFSLSIVIKKDTDFKNLTYIQIGNFEYSVGGSVSTNIKNIKLTNIVIYPFDLSMTFTDIVSSVNSDSIWSFLSSENYNKEFININPNNNENFGIFIMDNIYETEEYD